MKKGFDTAVIPGWEEGEEKPPTPPDGGDDPPKEEEEFESEEVDELREAATERMKDHSSEQKKARTEG
ncbi:hypothetical protein PRIPAC_81336 [Pristionchus pacificus]|uniref:Uncharacterized protein n=1 Tax=Pristionchus pacificus TaxID=54126 RepID=A0A2A6C3H1_PRIPA|nr:hypothetical protein PRIPAC_79909 [Pristionchus pacificus]KAF8374907.1 hypothetical protein PRIPAC_81336 [Pristionchus pacificus]|eukprot:PDM72265.1 hypothetical protein PRIPAC_38699 [Pristionchus pacificus]